MLTEINVNNKLINNNFAYNVLCDQISDIILIIDANCNLLDCNKSASDTFGINKEKLHSLNFFDLNILESKNYIENLFMYVSEGETLSLGELHFKSKNNELLTLEGKVTLMKQESLLVYVLVLRNVSQIKDLKNEIKEVCDKNNEINKQHQRFLHTVSHDLKTPLISIKGYVKNVEKKYFDNSDLEIKKYLNKVDSNVEKLELFINDIIELLKINKFNCEIDNFIAEKVIREAIDSFNLNKENIIISGDMPQITYSKERFYQVFINLISNAIDFSHPQRECKINISCKSYPANYIFSVEDNGIGIEKEYHETIFDEFVKISNKRENRGMGLSFVKAIIEKFHGYIWVESKVSQGSIFYFTIPK